MRTGLAITAVLLVLAIVAMLWMLERRARLTLQAAEAPVPQGLVKRLTAAAEHPDFIRGWVRPTVVGLVALFAGQLLNLAGCNTTPTQTRLDHDEAEIKQLKEDVVSRKELEDHWNAISKVQDQRDRRVERLENQYDSLAGELLRRSH